MTPADFRGITIRAPSSTAIRDTLRALGARAVDLTVRDVDTAVFSSFANDAQSLPSATDEFPSNVFTTADMSLFPRVDVFVASRAAVARLRPSRSGRSCDGPLPTRERQRSPPRASASEAETFCKAGGTIVRAPASALPALRARTAHWWTPCDAIPRRGRSSRGSRTCLRLMVQRRRIAHRRLRALSRRPTLTSTRRPRSRRSPASRHLPPRVLRRRPARGGCGRDGRAAERRPHDADVLRRGLGRAFRDRVARACTSTTLPRTAVARPPPDPAPLESGDAVRWPRPAGLEASATRRRHCHADRLALGTELDSDCVRRHLEARRLSERLRRPRKALGG